MFFLRKKEKREREKPPPDFRLEAWHKAPEMSVN